MTAKSYWYVLTTKPRAEKKVSEGLTKMGILHFLPLQKQLRQWKDRKKWVDMILFNSYLFVQDTGESRNDVFAVPGVLKYLSAEGKPCMVSDEEIERIRKICRYESELVSSREEFVSGDEVEITGGPLIGLLGRLIEKENAAYLSIQIENIGYAVSFKIDKGLVKKIRK
ncbi:MAG TPA: UpxY family transcription antiterminator [Chitinophagaceae bacterium]|nr:UpxY family transcription antiterminator [Chitinophagaceae bacterium]